LQYCITQTNLLSMAPHMLLIAPLLFPAAAAVNLGRATADRVKVTFYLESG